MKILVQDHHYNLFWTDAIYKDGRFRSPNENRSYEINSIYSIKDDDRNKTVICSACRREISNSPAAIRAHRNMVHKSNKCFDCRYLRHTNEQVVSHKYSLNDDGTYSESTKRTVKLKCNHCYGGYDINSAEAKEHCVYAPCEHAEFKHIEDFWTKYPNAFDEFITTDRIIDMGYKDMHKYYDFIAFELKGKLRITALTNNQGVCYCFELNYYRSTYLMRYSKKYDKVFVCNNGSFKDLSVMDFTSDTKDIIIKKLRTLYE